MIRRTSDHPQVRNWSLIHTEEEMYTVEVRHTQLNLLKLLEIVPVYELKVYNNFNNFDGVLCTCIMYISPHYV
jgi:hypothetical protein